MNLSKKIREQMLELCGSICEDDGIDPKEEKQPKERCEKDLYRQLRLCRQVQHTLALAITNCIDPLLRDLKIADVVPGANSSYLWVELRPEASNLNGDRPLEHLKEIQGWLRSEIAPAISRRQVPNLRFRWSTDDNEGGER